MCGPCGLTAQILAPPCGWRRRNDLDRVVRTAPFIWNLGVTWLRTATASAGSYGQRIERAEGFAQGMNRYPTLARAEIPTQYISGAFLTANELALDPRRV